MSRHRNCGNGAGCLTGFSGEARMFHRGERLTAVTPRFGVHLAFCCRFVTCRFAFVMFPTRALLTSARLTLFTRAGCGLCDTAKNTVLQLQKRRSFEYVE